MPLELQAARMRLVKDRPYLATAAWALRPVEKASLGTMAVDMWWRLYYDPTVAKRWSVEELAGVLYHEICHLIRDHAGRMTGLDPAVANVATDAEINDDILREAVKLPGNPITPKVIGQPEGLLAEEYYEALPRKTGGASGANAGDGGKSISSSSPTQSPGSSAQPTGGLAQPGAPNRSSGAGAKAGDGLDGSKTDVDNTPAPGSGRCGSCATGAPEAWEDGPPAEGNPSSGVGQTESELIRREVARQIAESCKSRGSIPDHWRRWAEEKLRPKVDWRRELAAVVRHAVADVSGAVDYTYRRPSRRQGQVGNGRVILPALRRPVPRVAVVVDTSGSIDDSMLAQALAEVSGILRSLGQRDGLHVLAVDAVVHSCRRVFRPEQVMLAGGGGTDMGVGLEAAARLRLRPQVVVVITDGETPWPKTPPPGIRVVVALVGPGGDSPTWARTINVPVSA